MNDNIGNVNRVLITVCYFIVMCVTVISSVVFLCILKAKYGNKFRKERIQVSILLLITLQTRRLTIVFAVAFLTRIVYNIWCLTLSNFGNSYTIFSTFVYVICVAFPLLYVFTTHMLEVESKNET